MIAAPLGLALVGPVRAEVTFPASLEVTCTAFTVQETRFRGAHAFWCVDLATGELNGAVLRRNGVPVCQLSGVWDFDAHCGHLNGCAALTAVGSLFACP